MQVDGYILWYKSVLLPSGFLDFHNVVGNEASVESDREGGYGDLRKWWKEYKRISNSF